MSWQPHTSTTEEVLEHGPVAALSALFDDGTPAPGMGDELPPLWHWVALARWPASTALGVDGHPARGSFLPPVELPRRMFAGGELTFHGGLRVGGTVRRESTVVSVTEKSGRSGPLAVVVVETKLYDNRGALAVEERQDIIYREAGPANASDVPPQPVAEVVPVGAPLARAGSWTWDFSTDPTLLTRFSAATANPHRIHYDWPYATRVECYPGLIVHGPLMSLALAELIRLEQHPGQVARIRHRNIRPLSCGEPARLSRTGISGDGSVELGLHGPAEPEPMTTLHVEFATE